MEFKYGIVDNQGVPVKFKSSFVDGYEVYRCHIDKVDLYPEQYVVEGEIKNINRIMNNDDFYEVWVSPDVELPLKVGKFEYIKRLVGVL